MENEWYFRPLASLPTRKPCPPTEYPIPDRLALTRNGPRLTDFRKMKPMTRLYFSRCRTSTSGTFFRGRQKDRSIFSKRPIYRSVFAVVHANAEWIPVPGSLRFAGSEWTNCVAVRAGDSDEWRRSRPPAARGLTDWLSKLSRAILKTVVKHGS